MQRTPCALLLSLLLAACAHQPASLPTAPLAQADADVQAMIDKQQMPGGELWIEHVGFGSYHRAYGQRAVEPTPEPLDESTIFDAASLTKAVVTSTLVQLLREQGKLDVEAPLSRYVPECADQAHAKITLRHLLTHSSGLAADLPGNGDFKRNGQWHGIADAVRLICALPLASDTGTQFKYSDLGFVLLGVIVSRQAAEPLEDFAKHALFEPLGMKDSSYLPLSQNFPAERIAPTEKAADGSFLRGVVHDPTARIMGGVAGHAGLFTTSTDLARYARMLLNNGVMENGKRLLSAQSIALMSQPQSPAGLPVRGMGWDIDTAYSRPRGKLYPKTSFGHTGFTGCSFWLDPASKSFYILLANRVHLSGPTNTLALYEQLGTLSAQAAGMAPKEPAQR